MSVDTVRSTVYLDPALHEALRESLREDADDLAAVAARAGERTMSYEALLSKLKADGAL